MAETTKKTAGASDGKELPAPVPPRRRGGLIQFYNDVIREMKKVTWPTGKETWLTTVMVFIMVGLTVVFFFMVDTVLSFGERLLIGAG
ncbi:MAG: preprotein translocase subunit SecE [Alphaproteobacteria bacterium]|nr:preprotein translocase subunit SecE [Alphaproteobacteria bacterium]MDE2265803.1 preprotein translocase subunit SecE [Alphaproteobacteria bacterium]MDE2500244.1 preprotein translocase subunit SecE [Alphaproteobacteria bacterium]